MGVEFGLKILLRVTNRHFATLILELLDEWLEEGVKKVQIKVGGSPDHLASLLSRIGSTVRDFHWDSRAMRNRLSQDK